MYSAAGYLIGAGSMSLGVERAGASLVQIYETPGYAKNAASWTMNRPEMPPVVIDLDKKISLPGIEGIDLLYGNPPCGGMSNMTGCHVDSPTNTCMIDWIHMAINTKPKLILMENAYQIGTNAGRVLREYMFSQLIANGYTPWVWVFYSWQLGCPQTRRRAFLCAVRNQKISESFYEKIVSLSDLPEEPDPEMNVISHIWDLENTEPKETGYVKSALGHLTDMHWWDNTGRRVSEYLRDHPEHFDIATNIHFMTPKQAKLWVNGTEKQKKEYEKKLKEGLYWHDCPQLFESMQQFRKPHLTPLYGPAHTVLSDFRLVHPTRRRLITMREQARLMGYSDDWRFTVCRANLTAQGVPAINSKWAVNRLYDLFEN